MPEKELKHPSTCVCGAPINYYGRRDLLDVIATAHGCCVADGKPIRARRELEPVIAAQLGKCTACFVRGTCNICDDKNAGVVVLLNGVDYGERRCARLGCAGHIRS